MATIVCILLVALAVDPSAEIPSPVAVGAALAASSSVILVICHTTSLEGRHLVTPNPPFLGSSVTQ
jgi:hypothetical protein